MQEVRCRGEKCNKKLGDFLSVKGTIRCPKCKKDNVLTL
jgi:phage FluMu protein Com